MFKNTEYNPQNYPNCTNIFTYYHLYKIFFKHIDLKHYNFLQFFTIFYLFRKYFGVHNNTTVFLTFFFFSKSFDLVNISKLSLYSNKILDYVLVTSTGFNKFPKMSVKIPLVSITNTLQKYYNTLKITLLYGRYPLNFSVLAPLKNVSLSKFSSFKPLYNSSSINKYLSLQDINRFELQFLRKNKVYNKGRYSRCRQNYRTGVYMCMYLSVISIFGLYFTFYKFSFNFTYLWWLFITFLGSFIFPKIIKYRLYEPITLLTKFFDLFGWISSLFSSIFNKRV